MRGKTKKELSILDLNKKFDPSEKEIVCDVCGCHMFNESYKWNKEAQDFFLVRRTELSHKKCIKNKST